MQKIEKSEARINPLLLIIIIYILTIYFAHFLQAVYPRLIARLFLILLGFFILLQVFL